jgi:hypothetical protein
MFIPLCHYRKSKNPEEIKCEGTKKKKEKATSFNQKGEVLKPNSGRISPKRRKKKKRTKKPTPSQCNQSVPVAHT